MAVAPSRSSQSLDAVDKLLGMVRVVERTIFAKVAGDLGGSLGRVCHHHFDIRSDFPGLCGKLEPGLIPQSYVCHQNLDILMGQSSDCLCGISRFNDPVSAVPEILTNCRAL